MSQDHGLELDLLIGRIARLSQALLDEGVEPLLVVFALASVAADMGLQITGDSLKVFPVLLSAIAHQASLRCEEEGPQFEGCGLKPPPGTTLH
jgi:hypothetical protein